MNINNTLFVILGHHHSLVLDITSYAVHVRRHNIWLSKVHVNHFYDLFDHFCVRTNLIEFVYLTNWYDSLLFKRIILVPKCSANSSTFHECVVIEKRWVKNLIYLKIIISSVSKPPCRSFGYIYILNMYIFCECRKYCLCINL